MKFFLKILYLIGGTAAGVVIVLFITNNYNYYFFKKKIFRMRKVSVIGKNIGRKEKMTVLRLSGLYYGENLLSINLKRVSRLIAEDKWFKDITVYRKFPDKIGIILKKRKIKAILNAGRLYYISRAGYVIGRADRQTGYDYPAITGINDSMISKNIGKYLMLLKKALYFLKISKGSVLTNNIGELHIQKDDAIVVYTKKGDEIKFGEGNFRQKFKTLNKLLYEIKTINLKYKPYINLEYKNEAVVAVNRGSRVLPANYKKIHILPDIWK